MSFSFTYIRINTGVSKSSFFFSVEVSVKLSKTTKKKPTTNKKKHTLVFPPFSLLYIPSPLFFSFATSFFFFCLKLFGQTRCAFHYSGDFCCCCFCCCLPVLLFLLPTFFVFSFCLSVSHRTVKGLKVVAPYHADRHP
ncbi:hypothetical protein STCU_10216 [Strigomonas culicis]|uniref:Uncharacterized protein n=1 Tax=Strigomonas culicis TaxID=28005 RepID=S9TNT5_9TRYP|nr:hypothetical protein STCU_10216 [Strigomonas culicis]|eukprot:EPY18048.1 hypothetical protein STCU_10216 [Strigomonas culicis]